MNPINLADKLEGIDDLWHPRVIAELNDYQFKLVKVEGDFVWHSHPDTDEAFLCLAGVLDIDLPDRTVRLTDGELFVVPKGVTHRPRAAATCQLLLIEPRGVVNTGDADPDPLTAPQEDWI